MPAVITINEVLDDLAALLRTFDTTARVIPSQLMGIEDSEDVDGYRSELDLQENNTQRVHAWTVFFNAGAMQRPGGPVPYTASHANRTFRADQTWSFIHKLYYAHEQGDYASNSTRRVNDLLQTVQRGYFKKPKLSLNNENLRQHNGLQILSSRIISAPDQKIHLVIARLDVQVWESIAP